MIPQENHMQIIRTFGILKAKQLADLDRLGDMSPSQLLNHMRCLNGQYKETPQIIDIFVCQLLNHTRSVISICSDDTSLTILADSTISYNDNI